MAITRALIDVMRERLGIENAELRERALMIAASAVNGPEAVMAQISALLPDLSASESADRSTLN